MHRIIDFVILCSSLTVTASQGALRSRIVSESNAYRKDSHHVFDFFSENLERPLVVELESSSRLLSERETLQSDLISFDGNSSNSVIRYLEESHYPEMIGMMIWNSSGYLERTSPFSVPGWTPLSEIHLFERTRPSEHGTAAYLLSTDVLTAVNWDLVPPIPFLTYTLPNLLKNDMQPFSLIPSPYDRTSFNRACIRHAEQVTLKVPFQERVNVLLWRGIPHGTDKNRLILFEISKSDPNNEWIDAVNIDEDPSKKMERDEMAQYKYQIDIGGESGTSWGGLRWKMCSGSLVFKVDSWSRDWWHDTIEPWKHYVPVKEDLSDLRQQYEWAETHPDEAFEIVQRGIATCKETASEDVVNAYNVKVIEALPPATKEHILEARAVLDGFGSFYQPLLGQKEEVFEEKEAMIAESAKLVQSDKK